LKRIYKSGRKGFNDAYDKRTVENFHEWRKQVKHLLYQTRVLTPLWGRMMKALRDELDALGELLSEYHDLAILRDRLATQLSGPENQVEIETLVALIDQRQDELEILARRLGARIYAESPAAFVSRSKVYWQTLRSEVKDEQIVLS
jgi:CHAD domain-containing protein